MKKITIVAVEMGMLLGIVAAAFLVPRSTPLLTFGLISGTFWIAGNLLLLRRVVSDPEKKGGGLSPRRNRNLNIIIILFIAYLTVCFLLRRH
jgi:hypothetical protein